jgi:hypothetical protein
MYECQCEFCKPRINFANLTVGDLFPETTRLNGQPFWGLIGQGQELVEKNHRLVEDYNQMFEDYENESNRACEAENMLIEIKEILR